VISQASVDSNCTGTDCKGAKRGLAAAFVAGSNVPEARACGFMSFDAPPKSAPSHLKHLQVWLIGRSAAVMKTRSKRYSRLGSLNKRGFSAAVVVFPWTCRARNDGIILDVCILHANPTFGLA
jgi:hypothetical protein